MRGMRAFVLSGCLVLGSWSMMPGTCQAQSYEERAAGVDMTDPDQVYELAIWCGENRKSLQKSKLLRQVVKMEPDHAPAREAMGFVQYNGRWVHHKRVPKSALGKINKPSSGGGSLKASGPGPKAADVQWNLTPMQHKDQREQPEKAQYVQSVINGVQNIDNYSSQMDVGFRTLLLEDYFELAVALLSQGLAKGTVKDLYAPAMMIDELRRNGDLKRLTKAERLVPFIMAASTKTTDAKDLQIMAMIAARTGERRAVPRLIELMNHSDDLVKDSAKMALAEITFLKEATMTPAEAQKWWDRYHAAPAAVVYKELIGSNDPMVRLGACRRMLSQQDNSILPVLVGLLQSGNMAARNGAIEILQIITGNDWGLNTDNEEMFAKNVELFKNWVKNESATFVWLPFRQQSMEDSLTDSGPRDDWSIHVSALASEKSAEARDAWDNLKEGGKAALPALLAGLDSNNAIVQQKSRDLLRDITGKNFGFDPFRGTAEDRAKAKKSWADLIQGGGEQAGDGAEK